MTSTPEDFARRVRSFAKAIPDVDRRAVRSGALLVKNTALGELRRAVGPDLRMSGVGRRGARVGVRFDETASGSSALVRATGPVHLVERSTRAHRIPRQRRRGRARPIAIPGVGVRASAMHPGTSGKRPWGQAIERAAPKVPVVVRDEYSKALRSSFGQ